VAITETVKRNRDFIFTSEKSIRHDWQFKSYDLPVSSRKICVKITDRYSVSFTTTAGHLDAFIKKAEPKGPARLMASRDVVISSG
jgi:hypothetical protein